MTVLTELSHLMPYMRLGQLIAYLTDRAEVPYSNTVPEIEDEDLLPVAKEFLEAMRKIPESHAEQIRGHLESSKYAIDQQL
jgi:hypothetical protein